MADMLLSCPFYCKNNNTKDCPYSNNINKFAACDAWEWQGREHDSQ